MSDDAILNLASSLLPKIKTRLGIEEDNTVNDSTITDVICDVIHELALCGVADSIINSPSSLGAIVKGVKDTWNYNGGSESGYSDDFYNRVDRLRRKVVVE